jgi:oligosaccharide repeat unit polymerase
VRVSGPAIPLAAGAVAALVLLTDFAPPPVYLLGALVILCSVGMVHAAAGISLRRLSIPAVWLVSYLVATAIPAFFVAADKDSPAVGPYLTAVLSTLVTVPAGMLLVREVTRFRRAEIAAFYAAPVSPPRPTAHGTAAYLVLFGVALALTAGYLIEAPVIPLFYLIQNPGAADILVGLREESFKLLDSPLLYAYDVLRRVVYPFLIAVALGWYFVTRQRFWLVVFLLSASIGVVYAALTIAKMPVAVIILVAILCLYLHVGGRVNVKAVVGGIAAVFLFPVAVLVQSLSGVGVSPWLIVRGLLNRLFYLPSEILYYYFEIVPDVVPHLNGRTIGRVGWVLGGQDFNISNYVFRYMFPYRVDTGTAPAPFIGNLHVDFGLVGVLVGGVLVGVLLQTIQVVLTRRPKTVVSLAAYAYLLWSSWKLNAESLTVALLSGGIIVIFALVEVFRMLEIFLRTTTSPPTRTASS